MIFKRDLLGILLEVHIEGSPRNGKNSYSCESLYFCINITFDMLFLNLQPKTRLLFLNNFSYEKRLKA